MTPPHTRAGTPAWWTDADRAEADVLAFELSRTAFIHREHCATCRAEGLRCPAMRDAIGAVVEWAERRRLLSEADWLRAQQELRDFEARLRAA